MFVVLLDFSFYPLFCTCDSLDDVARLLSEEPGPVGLFLESLGVSNNDETVFGSSDADIDPVLLLHELSS